MRGESVRREGCDGRECKGRDRGGAGGENPSPPVERLCTGMTSGAAAGMTSGGSCDGSGGEGVGVNAIPALGGPMTE